MNNKSVKRAFDILQRSAFYKVYKSKCSYCGHPLLLKNMELDHIIPRSKQDELLKIKEKFDLQLGNQSDINDYWNILPCCSSCNKTKKDNINETTIVTYLDKAQKNYEKIKKEIYDQKENLKLQNSGITLPFKIQFKNSLQIGPKNKEYIKELEKEEIDISSFNIEHLELYNDKDYINIQNIEQYMAAIEKGYYAPTQFDIKVEVNFLIINSLLYYLKLGKYAKRCVFSNINFSIDKFHLIDSAILDYVIQINGTFNEYEAKYNTLNQELKRQKIKIVENSKKILHLRFEHGGGKLIQELVRGNFTESAEEEILCSCYEYTDGTLGIAHMILLQMKNGLAVPSLFFV